MIPATAHVPGATFTRLAGLALFLLMRLKRPLLEAFLTNGVQAIWNSVENLRKKKTQESMIVLGSGCALDVLCL